MSNPIPPVRVDIIAGDNTAVPELKRTGEEIARVAAGANGGLSPMQKLSKAMVLSEGREGSLVLRELRGAMTMLGADALGASGHLGRLGISVAEFGIGGVTGIAAVGGFVLIAKEVEGLVNLTADLEAHLEKVNTQYAQLAGGAATARGHIRDIEREREQLRQPSFGTRLLASIVGNEIPGVTDTRTQQILASEATLSNEDNLARRKFDQQRHDALVAQQHDPLHTMQREAELLEETNRIRARAIATGQDEAATLVQIAEATARVNAQAQILNDKQTNDLVGQAVRIQRGKEENRVLEARRDILEEISQISADISRFFASGLAQAAIADIHVPDFNEIIGRTKHGMNINEDEFALGQGDRKRDALEMAAPFGKQAGDAMGKSFTEEALRHPNRLNVGRIGSEALAEIGALRQGSTSGALQGAGELAQTLGAAKSAGGLGIAGFTPVGIGLSLAGTALSLFDNSAERRHREEIAWLKKIAEKPVPEAVRVQPIFVGANASNAADVAYAVGRLQDRDATPRGVGGMP